MSINHSDEDIAIDRISSLPDVLIHHIFSFMNMEDVVHTSVLSNRWRYVWLSTPILYFNFDKWRIENGSYSNWPERMESFMKFVSKVMILGNKFNIVKFHLYSYEDCFEETRLCEWINAALQRNIEHFCFQFVVDQPLNFPDNLFTGNFEVLELFISSMWPTAHLPNSLCTAPYLKVLKLKVVILPEGDANGELILNCPLLETLQIFRCAAKHLKTLTISTPRLENLDLALYDGDSNAYTSCLVKICTPNLKLLELQTTFWTQGYTVVDYSMENLSSVVTAEFDIRDREEEPGPSYSSFDSDVSPYLMIPHSECLAKLLPSVHNVQYLKLSAYAIQVLTDVPELLERLPNLFHDLKCVMVMDRWAPPSVYAVLKFLERFPRIGTIVWERDSYESTIKPHKEDEWPKDFALEDNIFKCLITFEMHNFKGKEIEVKILEFLLQRATLLKTMIIKTHTKLLSEQKLAQVSDKLSSTPRASSSASISITVSKLGDD